MQVFRCMCSLPVGSVSHASSLTYPIFFSFPVLAMRRIDRCTSPSLLPELPLSTSLLCLGFSQAFPLHCISFSSKIRTFNLERTIKSGVGGIWSKGRHFSFSVGHGITGNTRQHLHWRFSLILKYELQENPGLRKVTLVSTSSPNFPDSTKWPQNTDPEAVPRLRSH